MQILQLKRPKSLISTPDYILNFKKLRKKLTENTFDDFTINIIPEDIQENTILKIIVSYSYIFFKYESERINMIRVIKFGFT